MCYALIYPCCNDALIYPLCKDAAAQYFCDTNEESYKPTITMPNGEKEELKCVHGRAHAYACVCACVRACVRAGIDNG